MQFFRKAGSFWFFIVVVIAAGYFSAFNLDYIYVNLPHIAEFKVRAAIAFMGAFLVGCLLSTLFFGIDSMSKSMKIRDLNKKLRIMAPSDGAPTGKNGRLRSLTGFSSDKQTTRPAAGEEG